MEQNEQIEEKNPSKKISWDCPFKDSSRLQLSLRWVPYRTWGVSLQKGGQPISISGPAVTALVVSCTQ